MSLERNVHFPANNLDQVGSFAPGFSVADDGLAVVDGQTTLDGHSDGESVIHFVAVAVVDAVNDVVDVVNDVVDVVNDVVDVVNDVVDVLDVNVFAHPLICLQFFNQSEHFVPAKNYKKWKIKINNKLFGFCYLNYFLSVLLSIVYLVIKHFLRLKFVRICH